MWLQSGQGKNEHIWWGLRFVRLLAHLAIHARASTSKTEEKNILLEFEGSGWILLDQNKIRQQYRVNTVVYIRNPNKVKYILSINRTTSINY